MPPLPHGAEAAHLFRKLCAGETLLPFASVLARLERFGVPLPRAERLFSLLDGRSRGAIDLDEWVRGFPHYVAVVAEHTEETEDDLLDFDSLPSECIALVLSYLVSNRTSLTNCAGTCAALRNAAFADAVWAPIFARRAWRDPASAEVAEARVTDFGAALAHFQRGRRVAQLHPTTSTDPVEEIAGTDNCSVSAPTSWRSSRCTSWREAYRDCLRQESCVVVELNRWQLWIGSVADARPMCVPLLSRGDPLRWASQPPRQCVN